MAFHFLAPLSALFFLLVFTLACLGLGRIILSACDNDHQFDHPLIILLGASSICVLGGMLNLFGLVHGLIIYTLIIFPLFFICIQPFFYSFLTKFQLAYRSISKVRKILLVFLFISIVIKMMLASLPNFNTHDDYQGYLILPLKMIQTGSFGNDLFNVRRYALLGGLSFIQAISLYFTPLQFINVVDRGFGWLLFVYLVWGHCKKRNVAPTLTIILLLFVNLLRLPSVNITSTGTAVAFFYGFIRIIQESNLTSSKTRAALISLVGAALCSLKSLNVVGWGVFLLYFVFFSTRIPFKKRCQELIVITILTAIFLLPWMLAMFNSCGTLLYPILGEGNYASSYSEFPRQAAGLFSSGYIFGAAAFLFRSPLILTGLAFLLFMFLRKNKREDIFQCGAVCAGSWLTALILLVTSGGIARYSYPVLLAALIFLLVEVLDQKEDAGKLKWYTQPVMPILIFGMFLIGIRDKGIEKNIPARLSQYFIGEQNFSKEKQKLQKAQLAVPPKASVAAYTSMPFLFDFKRNAIHVIDYPGGAGPPPGIQPYAAIEKTVGYLLKNECDFLIYSYGDEGGFPKDKYFHRLQLPDQGYFGFVRAMAHFRFTFQDKLAAMQKRYKAAYDDGMYWVVNLQKVSASH